MGRSVFLVGGMPTAGKSTIAAHLSHRLRLPWISTDQVGTIMRATASRDQYQKLFTWESRSDFRYLDELTTADISSSEFAKAEEVWLGVRQLIRQDHTWADGFIVEGDDVLPHLVARDFADTESVTAVFVGDLNADRVRKVVLTRNFAGAAAIHSDDVKEREVAWVIDYGERLRAQAMAHNMPWVDVEKDEHDFARVLEALHRHE